ncbi:hypothetical protein L873DRAFT_1189648 [Choiromyces venosus 120613-1]|uniref:Uncharacterized protein n=1 Tax=Choiromyces venosus 120613-1 TaxID=1336337 RepID=A0A3N4JF20_9PEZI|nr:hypothetical protein L873DRAFT_1189648 [Choiromyces venosus 120613-1]
MATFNYTTTFATAQCIESTPVVEISTADFEKFRLLFNWSNTDYDLKVKSVRDFAKRTTDNRNATPEELMDALAWRNVDLKRLESARFEDCCTYESKLRDGKITEIFNEVVLVRLSQGRSVDH